MLKSSCFLAMFMLIFMSTFTTIQAQEKKTRSLVYGVGIGYAETNDRVGGFGPNLAIGLVVPSKFNRLNFITNLHIESFLSGDGNRYRDEYFNLAYLDFILDYRYAKIKSVTFNIQGGGLVGNTRGLIGSGDVYNNQTSGYDSFVYSEFINNFNFGLKIALGLIIAPKDSRFSYCIYPFDFTLANYNLRAFSPKFYLKYKLK